METIPFTFSKSSIVILELEYAFNLSNIPTASLSPPSDKLAIISNTLSSILIFSASQIYFNLLTIFTLLILWNSKHWHLEIIVVGTLCKSVVAKINITCSGGSSSVFNKALNAPIDNICTSSII